MDQLLTPQQSIEARNTIGLSQSFIAKAIGLNRTYLSEFENGKRILEEYDLITLREYYLNSGWSGESNSHRQLKIIDGLAISPSLPDEDLEILLEEYRSLQQKILEMENEAAPRNIFGGIKENESLSKAFRVMIQYVRLRKLQLRLIGENQKQNDLDEKETYTIEDYIRYAINLF